MVAFRPIGCARRDLFWSRRHEVSVLRRVRLSLDPKNGIRYVVVLPQLQKLAERGRLSTEMDQGIRLTMNKTFSAFLVITLIFLAGCVSHHPTRADSVLCHSDPDVSTLKDTSGLKYVVLGEVHGTVEGPTVFADIVCAISKDTKVFVGLECSDNQVNDIEQYYVAGIADENIQLMSSIFDGNETGLSSFAVLSMIDEIGRLKSSGRDISLYGFVNSSPDDPPSSLQDIEDDYAKSILEQGVASGDGLHLILVGNFHGGRSLPDSLPAELRVTPMGGLLPIKQSLVFDMRSSGGNAWNCSSGCGVRKLNIPKTDKRYGVYRDQTMLPRFDGYWSIEEATPAKPINSQTR